MNLTGEQIVQQGIITGTINQENIQQVGVDLNLVDISLISGLGIISKNGKTVLSQRIPIHSTLTSINGQMTSAWNLLPGQYDITFEQGCNIPSDQRLRIVQRSSMLRNGTILSSSMFDPGFSTAAIGTVMIVHQPLIIEVGARIAQAYVTQVNPVENLYDGQWQNDKQRQQ